MLRLTRRPSREGYTVTLPSAARSASLRGGVPRQRLDIPAGSPRVSVRWRLGPSDYDALLAFYQRVAETSEKFEVELITGDFEARPHVCEFVPGSLRVADIGPTTYTVTATLQVEPLTAVYTAASDEGLMTAYEAYGDGASDVFRLLAELVNEDLPA